MAAVALEVNMATYSSAEALKGVSEAIEQEDIPPGYHQAIQSYFDAIRTEDPTLESEPASVLEE